MTNDKKTLRFFLDTEFNEHAARFAIDPISLALVPEDSTRDNFYAVSNDFVADKITPWLHENVVVHLPPPEQRQSPDDIRDNIIKYLKTFKADDIGKIEIWALNGSTDNVVLASLFGGLMGLQEAFNQAGLPRFEFREIKELTRATGVRLQPPENAHNCLVDALWTRDLFQACDAKLKKERRFLLE